jgi:hypothetical protein
MRRLLFAFLLIAVVPCVVMAGAREPASGATQPGSPPAAGRGEEWIQYDMDNWPWLWNDTGYMANMFYPRDPNWYPFQVNKVQFTYGQIDGGSAGVINRVRVFDAALAPIAEWSNIPGTTGIWMTVTAASPPTVYTGDAFYVGGWNFEATDGPLQGTVDAGLWPGTYWPAPNIEPFIWLKGPTTSAAWGGWTATTTSGSYYATTSVASFRVLVSGETVPVELYDLKGEPRRGYVVLSWSTASEQDNYGFNVYRSGAENGIYEKVNSALIPGHGTSATTHAYVFADYEVSKGGTYYYKIEDVGVDGSSSLHGPIAVPVGDEVSTSWGVIKATFK